MPDAAYLVGTRPARTPRAGRVLLSGGLVLVVVAAAAVAADHLGHGSHKTTAVASRRDAVLGAPVVPGAPVHVEIPVIGVSATVEPLGLFPSGHVAVPTSYDRVGWYEGSHVPGAPGPSVLLGHIDSHTGPAVFYRLSKLRPGDEIVVGRADAAIARFLVDRVAQFRKTAFPTAAVYGPTTAPTLRLITCAGPHHGHYRDNLVVFAHLKS